MTTLSERAAGAGREFVDTTRLCGRATLKCVEVVRDPKQDSFAHMNGVFFGVALPIVAVPLAVGMSVREFVNPGSQRPA